MKRDGIFVRIIATGSVGLVLVLGVLAACPEAHHWLHHDSDENGHDCAVVLFAHGLTAAADSATPGLAVFCILGVATVKYRQPDISPPHYAHQPGRGPPARG